MKKLDQQPEIIRRLRCAAGHLNAVIEMAEAAQSCEQILHQLNAVEAALRAAGIKLIICQAQSSQSIILDSPSPKQRIAELKRLQSLYTIFLQHPNYPIEVSHG
jgi:DNA-binding FrmR family transcriptional regulator